MSESFWVSEYRPSRTGVDGCKTDADEACDAARTYFENNHADFDYASEARLWVWKDGEAPRKFKVTAEQTMRFDATPAKPGE